MRRWILAVLSLLVVACGQVDPGERAVFVKWGEMEDQCFTEGFYWYNPVSTDMWEIDVKEQKYEAKADSGSKDLQDVYVTVVVNYTIDGTKCHTLLKNVGVDFKDRIIQPAVQEVVKANTAKFDAEKIIQERAALKRLVLTELRDRLDNYGITATEVALTNIGFGKEFGEAIERKAVQSQDNQTAGLKVQQAEREAEARVKQARGQAEANKLVRESLTKDLIQFEALKKWNGELPQVTGGAIPFIDIRGKE